MRVKAIPGLRKWLRLNSVSQAEFARRIGVKSPTVCVWLRGHVRPNADNRRIIEVLTAGAVGCDDWAKPTTRKRLGLAA